MLILKEGKDRGNEAKISRENGVEYHGKRAFRRIFGFLMLVFNSLRLFSDLSLPLTAFFKSNSQLHEIQIDSFCNFIADRIFFL